MGGPIKGRADYYKFGDYNAACSMCGRKRKTSEMVRNWQGLYRCPEHNEPRQPQDFARGVPDKMGVPWAQPETDIYVGPTLNYQFPAKIYPTSIYVDTSQPLVTQNGVVLVDENGTPITIGSLENALITENGTIITDENGIPFSVAGILASISAQVPDWVVNPSFAWSWQSGGAGITIVSPASANTQLSADLSSGPLSGVIQCVVSCTFGGSVLLSAPVSFA